VVVTDVETVRETNPGDECKDRLEFTGNWFIWEEMEEEGVKIHELSRE